MKKTFVFWGTALAVLFSLNSCNKEIQDPEEGDVVKKGTPFEIVANPVETRTENNGMSTNWVADDAISVLHAVASSTTYVNDGEFTITDPTSNTFSGTVAGTLEEGSSYDWYMVYPYNSHLVSIANTGSDPARYYIGKRSDQAQEQNGNDSKEHLAGTNFPLFGVQKNVASNVKPSLSVNHIASYIEVKVTNSNDSPLVVESVSFSAPDGEKIVGQYNIDFSTEPMTFTVYKTYASETANLTVTNGTSIAQGETASFFLGIKPFTAASGKVLKVSVNGYEKEINLINQTTFSAGKIKKINFDYDFDPSSIAKATFVFNTTAGLNDLGITAPATGQGTVLNGNTYTSNDISLSFATNGAGTDVRVWNSKGTYDLRTYTKNKLTFTAPNGYNITSIVLKGSSINGFSSNPTGYSSGTWSGDAASVILTASANGNINTIDVVCTKAQVVPVIVSDDVSGLAAPGAEYTETINLINYDSAPSLSAAVDGTVVTAATVSDVTTTSATVTYTVSNNISGAARSGSITLTDATNNVTGEITVGQKADVFTVSNTNIELAAAAGATKTLTLTSDYAWTIDDALIDGFTVTPMTGEGSSTGITLTVTSTGANASANVVELGAFAVQRTVDEKESATITVSQKSAKLATPVLVLEGDATAKTITVTWNAVYNAAKYQYYVLDSEMGYKVPVTVTEDNSTRSFTINNITLGETYYISVKAIGNNDPWIDSDEAEEEYSVEEGSKTATFTFKNMGYANAEDVTSILADDDDNTDISLVFAAGSNTQNSPKYYTTGQGVRMYNGNTLTIAGGTITRIVLTASGNYLTKATANTGTISTSGSTETWEGSATSVVLTATQTSRTQKIVVTYTK